MPDLPSGTVTFLFTDIEGSTALWERDRQAMAKAVERHIALLDAAIQDHGGVHFKTVGDAVQAAFPTAPQAVASAVAGQRALLAEDWREIGPLRVRMALHAGEAIPDARGDYLAAPLNRLSRLLSTGYGSQILLSQTVQQLSRGALPAGTELRDLGQHRLRDLLEPERVFQLVRPELPDQFPALKSLENRPNNLPLQPTPFLGREHEVDQIVELLRRPEVRFLTLTGPGGTGKTRLALQAAAELLDDFADGVFVVPFAPLTDPDLVPSTIAATLGIREDGAQPLLERLRDHLTAKQLLLVLDNLEHLADAAPSVGELLGTAPGLKVLATSRMPLRLRAERAYAVPPLGLPRRKPPPTLEQLSRFEAVRLFIDRAQAVKADFAIDNESAPAVAEICHRLDGLPLAIELAAARVRMLSPQAMLARLEQRLPLLTGGARDAPERQQTLRKTIAWSYDLLSPDEQALFRRLAVFAGGWAFEVAEAVANPDGDLDVFGGLERLLEQSLLRQEEGAGGEPRFTMLETIREFGLERLSEAGEDNAVRRRQAVYFADLADHAYPFLLQKGADETPWLDRLDAEQANLHAVLTWAFDHDTALALRCCAGVWPYWFTRGHWTEGREWLSRARAIGAAEVSQQASLATGAGYLAHVAEDYAEATALYAEALVAYQSLQDRFGEALALKQLGEVAAAQGDSQQATSLFEASAEIFHTLGLLSRAAVLQLNLALLADAAGDGQRALDLTEEAVAIQREHGQGWELGIALLALGWLLLGRQEYARAAPLLGDGLSVFRERGEQWRILNCLLGLASIATAVSSPERAARLYGAAAVLSEILGSPLDADERERQDRDLGTLRADLGDSGFALAYDAGRALSRDAAVAEALAMVEELVNTFES